MKHFVNTLVGLVILCAYPAVGGLEALVEYKIFGEWDWGMVGVAPILTVFAVLVLMLVWSLVHDLGCVVRGRPKTDRVWDPSK